MGAVVNLDAGCKMQDQWIQNCSKGIAKSPLLARIWRSRPSKSGSTEDVRSRMRRIMHRGSWILDRKGTVVVQALLILPILILIVFGSYTVWKVISIKQSLHSGTYQATRYLCLNPIDPPVPGIWEEVVEEIVTREMENNRLADGASRPRATVTFSGDRLECDLGFTVKTQVYLQIGIPYLSMLLTLQDSHEGRVECG
jgi:hypothetical protein